jgi:ubiquinol-cytochrome c reductase cytochrome c1 subunit
MNAQHIGKEKLGTSMKRILQTLKTICQVTILVAALGFGAVANASEGGYPLDKAPDRISQNASLQNGAKIFTANCVGCHSAVSMRYNRLRDIGLTDQQIKEGYISGDAKIGDLIISALNPKDAKAAYGKAPPDMSVEARARGTDWLYTYFRTYYKDDTTPSGWNNLVYPNVAMPHVLASMQGIRVAKFENRKDLHDPEKVERVFVKFDQISPGSMTNEEFDSNMGDLVSFLSWMAEPVQLERKRLGIFVLLFLAIFTLLAWRLNKAYWKDIK